MHVASKTPVTSFFFQAEYAGFFFRLTGLNLTRFLKIERPAIKAVAQSRLLIPQVRKDLTGRLRFRTVNVLVDRYIKNMIWDIHMKNKERNII